MKYLLDQNVPRRVALHLQDLYPGSIHLFDAGPSTAMDLDIWHYAAANGYVILTKDLDFYHLSMRFGPPPKVVWLRVGNLSVKLMVELLRDNELLVAKFNADPDTGLLILP